MRTYGRLDDLTAALLTVPREVAVPVDGDLDRAMSEPSRYFVNGHTVGQGHGRPFVPQIVRIVFG